MIIGYNEQVNKIIIIDTNGKKYTKKLSVYGLNIYPNNKYTYYDNKGLVHMLNMDYIKELKLYHDNIYIKSIYE